MEATAPRTTAIRLFSFSTDATDVVALEKELFSSPWEKADLNKYRKSGHGGFVMRDANRLLGYLFYEIKIKNKQATMHITNLAIREKDRRKGYGTRLIQMAKDVTKKADSKDGNCAKIRAYVGEEELGLQLFLRKVNFFCDKVVHNHFAEGQTAYRFNFEVRKHESAGTAVAPSSP